MAEIFKSDTCPFVSFKKEVSMSSGLSSSADGTVVELWLSVLFVCFLFTSLFSLKLFCGSNCYRKCFSFLFSPFYFVFFFVFVFILSSFFVILLYFYFNQTP